MESLSSPDSKLFISSQDGDIQGVISALFQGGRVTARCPQGFYAVPRGHTEICSLLLEHGSNVTDTCLKGATPLLYAAQHGHTKVCKLLLEHRSDVNEGTPP